MFPERFLKPIDLHVKEPNKSKILDLYTEHASKFVKSPGSLSTHQVWEGGYIDHVVDMFDIAEILWNAKMNHQIDLPFDFGDLVLVVALHDIEKPFKYCNDEFFTTKTMKEILSFLMSDYKFELTPMHLNALKYAHGENEDYKRGERVMNELAAYLHACDVISARAHYNHRKIVK